MEEVLHLGLKRSMVAPAIVAGLVSTASFVLIAKVVGGYNAAIEKVVTVDIAISAMLFAALVANQVIRVQGWSR